jgi:MFS family permease
MYTLSKLDRENFSHLYAEIFWYGIFNGTTLSFWAVYAARQGATPFEIGLLNSGPGLVSLLLSLPAVYLLEKSHPERATFFSSVVHRVLFILLIFIPWLHGSAVQIWTIVIIAFISAIPGTFLNIGANLMLSEVIPMEWRATVIGRRNALLSVTVTLSLLLSGVILVRVAYPINYQIVFGIGLLGAAVGSYHLGKVISLRRLKEIAIISQDQAAFLEGTLGFFKAGMQSFLKAGFRNLLHLDLLRSQFGPFIASYLILYTIVSLPIPIYTLFLVNTIHVSDGVISLGNALYFVSMLLFSLLLARISRRLGHKGALVYSTLGFTLYPLLGGLAQGPILFYVASLIGGATWGIGSGALINRLFERTPENDLTASMALHNLVLNLGTMVGVLIGSALAEWMGLRTSLILTGALRLVGVVVLVFWG